MHLARTLRVLLVAGALVAVPQATPTTATATGPVIGPYVSIGDSYAAGLGIPTTTYAGGCYRSNSNTASLLGRLFKITRATDVSCTGARPSDTTRRQDKVITPQFRALSRNTQLVTVRLGINQGGLFGGLVSGCPAVRDRDRFGSPCRDAAQGPEGDGFLRLADDAGAAVQGVLEGIRARAPKAQIVVIGYPRLAPDSGTCAALPLAAGDYAYVNEVVRRLDDNLARAARTTGADYVDMWRASRNHDICAARPWLQGAVNANNKASPYHPLQVEQRAVANRVAARVKARLAQTTR